MNNTLITSVAKQGAVGVSAVTLSVITSYQEHIEWAFRTAGMFLGCAVSITTLVVIIRKARHDELQYLAALEKREKEIKE